MQKYVKLWLTGLFFFTSAFFSLYAAGGVVLKHNSVFTPFATIQQAVDASVDGDAVIISAGTFTEQVTITTGITLQGAGIGLTIIESPAAAALNISGGTWKNLKAQDLFSVVGVKVATNALFTIKNLTIDGLNNGYQPDLRYGNKMDYAFQGISILNTNALVDSVEVKNTRELDSDYLGSFIPPGYLPADQPAGMNHNENILVESSRSAGYHAVTIRNSKFSGFQKTSILAWGPTLFITIENNTIQGYGKTLYSTGNGIQVSSSDLSGFGGFYGDRSGTNSLIINNKILEIGLDIPTPGNPGSYLNLGLGGPSGILVYEGGSNIIITGNLISRSAYVPTWHSSYLSTDGGFCNNGIDIVSTSNVHINNNTITNYDFAITSEVNVNPSQVIVENNNTVGNFFTFANNGNSSHHYILGAGAETIAYLTETCGPDLVTNWGAGDKFYLMDPVTPGIVNGMLGGNPAVDLTAGTVTEGNGTNTAPYSIQISRPVDVDGKTITYLYVNGTAVPGAAALTIKLEGRYLVGNFVLDGPFIKYIDYSPPTQASGIDVVSQTENSAVFICEPGGGEARVVFMKESTDGASSLGSGEGNNYAPNNNLQVNSQNGNGAPLPLNGVTYTPNVNFGQGDELTGSGWFCVYNGTGTQFRVEGLKSGTRYSALVVEYNGQPGREAYNANVSVSNLTTLRTLVSQKNSKFTITSPNGGENLSGGVYRKITWSRAGIIQGSQQLEYSTDGGNSWQKISSTPIAGIMSYQWLVPEINSSHCLVRLVNYLTKKEYDRSDNEFTISSSGGVQSYNYPNPFNPSTRIVFSIPNQTRVTLNVYNSIGQNVKELVNSELAAGSHEVEFNASSLPSGVYYYRLEAGGKKQINKILLIK